MLSGQGLQPIGQWRDHLPMRAIHSLALSTNTLVVGTPFGYFLYTPSSKEINTFTKSDGLSEVGLRLISKDPNSEGILVVYENANLDLMSGDQLRNIPDLFKSNIQADKTINHVQWIGEDAFLATNFGIVVLNTQRVEIRDTYRPGKNGSSVIVNQTVLHKGLLYAATSEGLLKASFPSSSLADFRNWTNEEILRAQHPIQRVLVWNDKLVAERNDSVFQKSENQWNLLYASKKKITTIVVVNNQLYVGESAQNKGNFVVIEPNSGTIKILDSKHLTYPTACELLDNQIWVADFQNGIVELGNEGTTPVYPETPDGIALGEGYYADGLIFASAGQQIYSAVNNKKAAGIYKYDGNAWENFTSYTLAALDTINDLRSVVYYPSSGSIYAGSYEDGLLEITKDNKLNLFKQNSFLSSAINSNASYRVGGLALDKDQQLWITNSDALQGLVVKKKDGTTKKITIPFSYAGYALSKIIVDLDNRKWMIAPNGDGVFCFDHGENIDQIGDDQWRHFKQGLGRGNLPSNQVTSLACDRNGFIWLGTDKGLAVVQCTEELFSASCEAILPVVQQDNFAGRLLSEEIINDIKMDGADRKWIATSNGVWLLSADGQKVIGRFTEKNSVLLSDDVRSIVIHQKTGEVFFFTKNGICSFRGTATEPETIEKKPFVFPNPVPPGYTGTIAIRDLPENAWVRITELDGRLVYQTRSLGGQAIWSGKNYKGERASSGTYLIFVSNENNTQQVVGKIFFIK
jgi:ligand-binding sensor domain-containing protein